MRIALNLKNLPYDYAPIHLLRDGGEQLKPAYRSLNPDAILPTLVDGGNSSRTIIEYGRSASRPPLLPKSWPTARIAIGGATGAACARFIR